MSFLLALAGLFCGCASEQLKAGHGDVGQFILRQAVSYGGNPTVTNGLPIISERWRYSEDINGVVIFMSRNDYSSVESFLTQAFGKPQFGPKDTSDGGRMGEYRLTSKGGGIQFSHDDNDTEVVIIRPLGQGSQHLF